MSTAAIVAIIQAIVAGVPKLIELIKQGETPPTSSSTNLYPLTPLPKSVQPIRRLTTTSTTADRRGHGPQSQKPI